MQPSLTNSNLDMSHRATIRQYHLQNTTVIFNAAS